MFAIPTFNEARRDCRRRRAILVLGLCLLWDEFLRENVHRVEIFIGNVDEMGAPICRCPRFGFFPASKLFNIISEMPPCKDQWLWRG